MALAALHLLGHVKSTWAAAFRGLYALAVDDAGRRRRLAPDGLTRAPDETAIDAMPRPVVPPTVEVALHGRARRKFSPERPPLSIPNLPPQLLSLCPILFRLPLHCRVAWALALGPVP